MRVNWPDAIARTACDNHLQAGSGFQLWLS